MSVHLTYRVRCSICQPWTFIDAPGASCVAEAREQAKERGWTQRETPDGVEDVCPQHRHGDWPGEIPPMDEP